MGNLEHTQKRGGYQNFSFQLSGRLSWTVFIVKCSNPNVANNLSVVILSVDKKAHAENKESKWTSVISRASGS